MQHANLPELKTHVLLRKPPFYTYLFLEDHHLYQVRTDKSIQSTDKRS